MAPEQVRGEEVDVRADVYALGAVLFEILTLERLHTGDASVIASSTLKGADARASRYAVDGPVPPELEELCVRATAMSPNARPSAKEMHDRVQEFLDGQRDLEERQRQSRVHYTRALEANKGARRAGREAAAREETLRELSRAIALDESNEEARALLHELVAGPRSDDDEAVAEAMKVSAEAMRRLLSRMAIGLFAAWIVLSSGAFVLGVRKWADVGVLLGLVVVCSVLLVAYMKKQTGVRAWAVLLSAELAAAATALTSGAFVLPAPILSCIGVAFTLGATNAKFVDRNDPLLRALPYAVPLTGAVTSLVTVWLNLRGIAFAPIRFTGEAVVLTAGTIAFPDVYTPTLLTIINTALIVGPTILVSRGRALASRLERRTLAEVANLRPLVPGASSSLREIVTKDDERQD
jgi:serine/threonine-protein kinase